MTEATEVSTEEPTQPNVETPAAGASQTPQGDQPQGDQPTGADPEPDGEGAEGEESIDSLPEWAQRQIRDLRRENASRRSALREAEEKLAEAKTSEEYEAAVSELQVANKNLEMQVARERVARQVALPDALMARLRGETEEELLADAKELAKLVRPTAGIGLGGLDPSEPPADDDYDPVEIVRKIRGRRR